MTPAIQARQQAGLTLEQAAKQARIGIPYLRAIEKGRGACSYPLAMRLSRLYRCSANVFLYTKKGSETPAKRTGQAAQKNGPEKKLKKKPEAGRLRASEEK